MVLLQVHHRLEESTEELQYNHLKQSYHSRKESRYLRYLCVPDDEFDICQIIECSTLNHLLTNHFLRVNIIPPHKGNLSYAGLRPQKIMAEALEKRLSPREIYV